MIINNISVGQLESNCYLLSDEETSNAIVIDPGDEPDGQDASESDDSSGLSGSSLRAGAASSLLVWVVFFFLFIIIPIFSVR